MPIKTQNDLPAKEILENENIFVMDEFRALHQDMRPLQVLILNNMPVKQDTELQLLRALSNTHTINTGRLLCQSYAYDARNQGEQNSAVPPPGKGASEKSHLFSRGYAGGATGGRDGNRADFPHQMEPLCRPGK